MQYINKRLVICSIYSPFAALASYTMVALMIAQMQFIGPSFSLYVKIHPEWICHPAVFAKANQLMSHIVP